MGSAWPCPVLINSELTMDSYLRLDGTPDDNRPVVQESHREHKNHGTTDKDRMTESGSRKEKRKKTSLQHHQVRQNTPSGITHSLRLFCCPGLLLSVCCFALDICRA